MLHRPIQDSLHLHRCPLATLAGDVAFGIEVIGDALKCEAFGLHLFDDRHHVCHFFDGSLNSVRCGSSRTPDAPRLREIGWSAEFDTTGFEDR